MRTAIYSVRMIIFNNIIQLQTTKCNKPNIWNTNK